MNESKSEEPAVSPPGLRVPQKANEAGSCQHCGALVYGDNIRCPQCGKFPIVMRQCPRCKSIAAPTATHCWKCRRMFEPDGDFL